MPIDQATLAAVKATKREVHASESHKRQLRRISSRKRAALALTQARTQSHVDVIKAREASASKILAEREAFREAHQPTIQSSVKDRAVGKVVSTATPSSDSGLIMTTLFVVGGLIVAYMLVTNATATTGWLGYLGDAIHALSSNKPLFTVKEAN